MKYSTYFLGFVVCVFFLTDSSTEAAGIKSTKEEIVAATVFSSSRILTKNSLRTCDKKVCQAQDMAKIFCRSLKFHSKQIFDDGRVLDSRKTKTGLQLLKTVCIVKKNKDDGENPNPLKNISAISAISSHDKYGGSSLENCSKRIRNGKKCNKDILAHSFCRGHGFNRGTPFDTSIIDGVVHLHYAICLQERKVLPSLPVVRKYSAGYYAFEDVYPKDVDDKLRENAKAVSDYEFERVRGGPDEVTTFKQLCKSIHLTCVHVKDHNQTRREDGTIAMGREFNCGIKAKDASRMAFCH